MVLYFLKVINDLFFSPSMVLFFFRFVYSFCSFWIISLSCSMNPWFSKKPGGSCDSWVGLIHWELPCRVYLSGLFHWKTPNVKIFRSFLLGWSSFPEKDPPFYRLEEEGLASGILGTGLERVWDSQLQHQAYALHCRDELPVFSHGKRGVLGEGEDAGIQLFHKQTSEQSSSSWPYLYSHPRA